MSDARRPAGDVSNLTAMAFIYKIVPAALWREAETAGIFAGAPVDLQDGFIHFSTAAQWRDTAARHFAGEADLLLVEVDATALGEALRFEPSRGGDLFPHLYGSLPLSAVRRVVPLALGADGRHVPAEALAGPSFDPGAQGWTPRPSHGFAGVFGTVWGRKDEDGTPFYGFASDARHANVNGVIHGGVLVSFADEALGRTSFTLNDRKPVATIQLDSHFVAAGRPGDFITADCRVVRQTRSLLFMASTVRSGDRVVLAANGIWKALGA